MTTDGVITIRPLHEDDYPQLSAWLSDPRVLEFYEGRDRPQSIEDVRENYAAEDDHTPCLIEEHNIPIGYIQFYSTDDEDVWGIDQFIGVPEQWNRGLGTRIVQLMLQYLFEQRYAKKVVLDPHASNTRAIRCYEKAGFRKVKLLERHELHEGEYRDCWLMECLNNKA